MGRSDFQGESQRPRPTLAQLVTLSFKQIKGFLTDEEADQLIELGHEQLTEEHGEEWRTRQYAPKHTPSVALNFGPPLSLLTTNCSCVDRSAYATVFFKQNAYASNILLRDIEDRIARLTMIRLEECQTQRLKRMQVGS